MIGIKVKNQLLAQNLIHFYPEKMEIVQPQKNYSAFITDDAQNDFKGPVLYLNCPQKLFNLNIPFSLQEISSALTQLTLQPIELKFYLWQEKKRLIINKKTKQKINLTQKESELISFLWHAPHHSATKETLLNEVWHYHEKAQTHTLTTHLYQLKQKMGEKSPPLIEFKKNLYHLL